MVWSESSYAYWPATPGGNEIEHVTLDPGSVISTANDMIAVASRMKQAAITLRELANSADGQQGKAIEKLRDSVGETWEILGDAGEMYYDTADAIRTYGEEIDDIAASLSAAYTLADERWSTYSQADGELHGDRTADADDDDPNAASDAADNQTKYDAFQAWMDAADDWDGYYEDWETAWNKAVTAIENAHEHGPKDGWNEWWGDVLEVAYIVLTVIAVVAAIVAIVCTVVLTGPIVAAIAAVATVVGTIAGVLIAAVSVTRYLRGDTDSLAAVLIDIVCAIPLAGPMTRLFSEAGPLLSRLSVGAGGLVGDLIGPTFSFGSDGVLTISRAFGNSVDDMIVHGGVGLNLLFDAGIKNGDTIDTLVRMWPGLLTLTGYAEGD